VSLVDPDCFAARASVDLVDEPVDAREGFTGLGEIHDEQGFPADMSENTDVRAGGTTSRRAMRRSVASSGDPGSHAQASAAQNQA
jgi:hypothetical protein